MSNKKNIDSFSKEMDFAYVAIRDDEILEKRTIEEISESVDTDDGIEQSENSFE